MKGWLWIGSVLVTAMLASGQSALAQVTVEGKAFAARVTVEGKDLKLLGAGLREKWFFNVYAMGAYSESGNCDPKAIIDADEVKYLRLEMLRDVGAEKMSTTIGESFKKAMPKDASADLSTQRTTFMSYFKDECTKGTVIEFTYVPGIGTMLKQNGKTLGAPLAGPDFAKVLWRIYFAEDTCCESLKDGILATCK